MKKNQLISIMFFFAMIAMQGQTNLTTLGTGVGTTGNESVYVGDLVGANSGPASSTVNRENTFVGYTAARFFKTGLENTFVGRKSGNGSTFSTNGTYNTASFNSFFGSKAGEYITTGAHNSFFGRASGITNTTGEHNVFIGSSSGYFNTTGSKNVYIGFQSGNYTNTGVENTFVGRTSGLGNIGVYNTGSQNSFFGSATGKDNTTGSYNAFYGRASGHHNTTGSSNAFIGAHSGYNNTVGTRNTYLGSYAGNNATSGSDNVFIGYFAGSNETGSNKLHINNTSTGNSLISGDFSTNQVGINTNDVPSTYTLAVDGKIIVEEVKVELSTNWPDYVFEKDYKLPKLTDVEKHIKEKGHLPNIPSAAEVKKEGGISLGEMNKKLLEKVEQLMLYTIQQEKRIKALEKKLAKKKG